MKSPGKPLSQTLLVTLLVIVSALIALGMHAALPAKVDESLLDGLLVERCGFVVVAAIYFIVLFAHAAVVLILNRDKLLLHRLRAAWYFGLSFTLIYMIGMQEIVLDASPYEHWGIDFVVYQLLMGIGDAIPAVFLCLLIGTIFFTTRCNAGRPTDRGDVVTVLSFTVIMGTTRLLAYYSGAIGNELTAYYAPVTIWSYLLGLVFGIAYLLIGRTTVAKMRTMLLGIGINWMIFNLFIGLVKKDAMADSLLRGAIDMLAIVVAMGLSTMVRRSRAGATNRSA